MGGEAENLHFQPHEAQKSSSHTPRRSGGTALVFSEGSLVEVRTDEVDFEGVYFSATVIASPPISPRKAGKKKSRNLYVEYRDLLAREDGADRLREHVKLSHVRPAPPLQEIVKGFERDDIVDAFYKDGWWTGVVSRVLEGGERYVVTFHNPPDELEFGLADLRAHWDWVNGSWVRPQRQSIVGLMFDVGRKIEVSFAREDSQDAWFPATIRNDLGKGVFLVEHMDNNGQAIQARVDSLHVRPCPPLLKDKNFVLLEKVDAFFDFGWWSGVITKELENCRYIVFFKKMKKEKEFNQSELRPHMDWKDGKWFTSSQEASIPSDDGVHEHYTPENSSASVATASTAQLENSVDGRDTYNGKSTSSLTSTKGHLTSDNQKTSLVTTKRKQHLSEYGDSPSQPPKKLKDGGVVEQDKHDEPLQEALCVIISPDSVNDIEISATQTKGDQSSFQSSWGEKSRKPRNFRAKHDADGNINTPLSSTMKSSTKMLFERLGLDDAEEVEPNAAGNKNGEDTPNELAKEATELPVIIGLPCSDTGNPEYGISASGGRKRRQFNSKEIVTIVNFQEQKLQYSSVQEIRGSTQSETEGPSPKRRRGRPKKYLVESTQTPVRENAQSGGVGSSDLNSKDDGLKMIPQVEEVVTSDQRMIAANEEELANNQSTLKSERVRMMKKKLPKEKGVEESVGQGDDRPLKRGRKRITGEKIAVEVQDPTDESGVKMMELNRIVDTNRVVGEVPSNELDNEPLSKWIEEMHAPSTIDSSRPSTEGNLEQSIADAEKQIGLVETQPERESRASASTDKDSLVRKKPQSLPSVANTVVLVDDREQQPESVTRISASPSVDNGNVVPREPQVLPFVENTSLWKSIESTMEIFQKMPQKPHFKPLQEIKGSSSREGLAIGYMVAFASLADRTSKLDLKDPRNVVDDLMGTVAELEKHGFDVGFVQDHVTKFLEAKDKQEHLVEEVNNLNNRISEHCQEKTKFDEEILEMKEQIKKLEEKISLAQLGKVKEDNEIASLQTRLKDTEEGIENLRRDFKVSSGIWP